MKKKIIGSIICMLLIAVAVLPAVGTLNIDDYNNSVLTEEKYPNKSITSISQVKSILSENILAPIAKKEKDVPLKTIEGKKSPLDVKSALLLGDIPLATTLEDEFHPTLARDNSGWLFGAYTHEIDILEASIFFAFSEDRGETWENTNIKDLWVVEGVLDYPAIDYWGSGNKFIGTFQPDPNDLDGSAEYLLTVEDPTDIETWNLGYYDWSSQHMLSNRQSPDIAGYSDVGDNTWFYGVMATVVDSDYNAGGYLPGEDIPCICFPNYNEEGSEWNWWFNWEGGTHVNCAHPCVDIDRSNGMMYAAWDWYNESAPEKGRDIFLTTADVHDWWEEKWELNWYTIGGTEENTFPDIAAENNYVYIVAQTDLSGNQDLVCYYSSDSGVNFDMSIVTNTIEDETNPAVYASGKDAACIFTKDNDLFIAYTHDGGVNWEIDEHPINDEPGSVIEQYKCADIFGGSAVWTDSRNDNKDIYYETLSNPPTAPTITGPPSGSPGTPYDYNLKAIDPDGDNVRYHIDWGDDNEEWTDYAESGTPVIATHTWANKGEYIVTAYAEDSNGFSGQEATFIVTMPRNRVINSPFKSYLQNHLNIFLLLKLLQQR